MKARVKRTNKVIKVYRTGKQALGGECLTVHQYKDYDGNEYWSDELEFVPDDMPLSDPEDDVIIEGFVARDDSGPRDLGLRLYTVMPTRGKNQKRWNGRGEKSVLIDHRLFPSITWDSDPLPVTLSIKPKK